MNMTTTTRPPRLRPRATRYTWWEKERHFTP
ncbi:hypothetical protein Ahy_A05g022072 isoform A [Arachis hypogaea]|uniref:Uncharacterized protein n=1 Tax=Arachis hypogaea TaxID=3818 RepID=A0A445CZK1_ARAHY|nr:hypothetical protein Ahy_A05g022072 isoform A [Arachis hypogaea]